MENRQRDFNAEAASWDQPGRVTLARDVVAAVRNAVALTPDMDVLDFGCGTGLLSLELLPAVRSVTGVDSSTGMIDALNEKIKNRGLSGIAARYLDIGRGDVLEGKYHLIVSSMTLHHVQDVPALLSRLHGVSLPGGRIALADLDSEGGLFHPDPAGVFHQGFDRAALAGQLRAAGFSDVKTATAARVVKPLADGTLHEFTIFLITAGNSR